MKIKSPGADWSEPCRTKFRPRRTQLFSQSRSNFRAASSLRPSDECLEGFEQQGKMPADDSSRANAPSYRRGMRKGTRSCFECRRRKVRCIFAKDSTICEGCVAKGKPCTEQRRELIQDAALDTRESLRERVARLEALLQASSSGGSSAGITQLSSRSEFDSRDTQPGTIRTVSPSSSIASNPTPTSMPLRDVSVSIRKDSPQNIDPLVTLFDNAIVRLIVYLDLWLLTTRKVETT